MLYFNGKHLLLSGGNSNPELDAVAKRVKADFDRLREGQSTMQSPRRITYTRDKETFAYTENGTKLSQVPAGAPIPLEATIAGKNGPEHWAYSATPIVLSDKGELKLKKKRLDFEGTLLLGEDKIDLLWFLTHISPFCENPIGRLPSKKRHHFRLEDKEQ
jgi:hypothetical protein